MKWRTRSKKSYIKSGLQGFHRPVTFDSKNLHRMGTQHWQGAPPKHKNLDPSMAVGCLQRPKSNQQQQRETLSKRASNSLPQCNTKRVVFTCRYHLLLGGLSHQQNKALEVLTIAQQDKVLEYLSLTINQPSCLFESNHPPFFCVLGGTGVFFLSPAPAT